MPIKAVILHQFESDISTVPKRADYANRHLTFIQSVIVMGVNQTSVDKSLYNSLLYVRIGPILDFTIRAE